MKLFFPGLACLSFSSFSGIHNSKIRYEPNLFDSVFIRNDSLPHPYAYKGKMGAVQSSVTVNGKTKLVFADAVFIKSAEAWDVQLTDEQHFRLHIRIEGDSFSTLLISPLDPPMKYFGRNQSLALKDRPSNGKDLFGKIWLKTKGAHGMLLVEGYFRCRTEY